MRKLPTDSRLGPALRSHRREKGLTQAALAASAGLTEKTLRQLEQGRGNLDSWHAVLRQLGLELAGRNLPPGDTLGSRLAALRRRRRLGQRALAELVGVSPPTIIALEGQGSGGRLDTLERVLETLRRGAYLAAAGQAKAFFTHAGTPRSATGGRRRGSCSRPSTRSSAGSTSTPAPPGGRGRG